MRGREWLAVWSVAAAVAAGAAVFVAQPAYMDAHYYFGGALQLARGRGFTEPYVWNYLAPVRELPAPSHLYWMPLTSLVAAPFMALAEWGAGAALPNARLFRLAQAPLVAATAGLATLAGWVAWRTAGRRRHAWAAALLTVFSAFYFPFWTTTDSFALFGLAAAGALVVFAGVFMDQPGLSPAVPPGLGPAPAGRRSFPISDTSTPTAHTSITLNLFLSGLLAGLAHLARADGLLMLLCLLAFLVLRPWRTATASTPGLNPLPLSSSRPSPFVIGHLSFVILLGYLLPMSPWYLRNLAVFGTPLAPGGARALWLTGYDELFTYAPETLTLAHYLAAGWGVILAGKWEALNTNLQSLIAVQSSIVAFPFALVGGWQLRRRPLFQAAGLYGLALFLAMTFAFTFPGVRGGYFHSGAALLPFIYPAALVGLDVSVEAAARRLRHWQPEKSKPVFTALLVAGVAALALVRFPGAAAGTRQADAVYAKIGAWLDGAGNLPADQAAVAVNNPPAFYYHTGRPAIAVPAGDQETLVQAMTDFGVRWLALDVNVVPALSLLYQQPDADPRFQRRATFQDSAGRPVYLLELTLSAAPNP